MPKKNEQEVATAVEHVQRWLALRKTGMSSDEAAAQVGLDRTTLQGYRRKYCPELTVTKETIGKDGQVSKTEKGLRKNQDIDTSNMEIVSVTKSPYGGAFVKYANKSDVLTYEDIRDELIKEMDKHSPKYPKISRKPIQDGHLLVVSPTDIHIGRYASLSETGRSYNTEIAVRDATNALEGLIQKSSGFNIDKIFFLGGHDILNVDNSHKTTTAGTKQDNDGQLSEGFLAAKKLCVHMLESLMSIADVHVMYNPSNHDYDSGFMLFDSLASWFRLCEHITFDYTMAHRKYATYGNSLIMTSHGDGAKEKDLVKLMAAEAKEKWASTDHRYIYLGHLHHRIAKDDIGASIEYTRTIAPACSWSHRNGYINKPAMEAFIHSKDNGQVCRLTHYA